MMFMGYIIFCLVLIMVTCLSVYHLLVNKQLASSEKIRLRRRVGVLTVLSLAVLVGGGVFGHVAFLSRNILSVASSIIINSVLITLIFSRLERHFNFPRLKLVYYFGLFCIFMTSLALVESQSMNHDILETSVIVASFVVSSSLLVWIACIFVKLFLSARGNQFSATKRPIAYTNKDKIQHYYEEGLTESEVEYFRSQMAIARDQIKSVESGIAKTAKLRAIEVRYNTIEVAQNFFKDIVDDPTRFTQASQFLYKFLPSLEDLILKYNEINGHVAKNKQTYLILEKSAQTIEQICEQITDEYVLFHQDTYNEMQDEIKLANRNLSRKAARQQMSSEQEDIDNMTDSVDAILKESNDWLADQEDESSQGGQYDRR